MGGDARQEQGLEMRAAHSVLPWCLRRCTRERVDEGVFQWRECQERLDVSADVYLLQRFLVVPTVSQTPTHLTGTVLFFVNPAYTVSVRLQNKPRSGFTSRSQSVYASSLMFGFCVKSGKVPAGHGSSKGETYPGTIWFSQSLKIGKK